MLVEPIERASEIGALPLRHGDLTPPPCDNGLNGVSAPLLPEDEGCIHDRRIEAGPADGLGLGPVAERLRNVAALNGDADWNQVAPPWVGGDGMGKGWGPVAGLRSDLF